MNVGQMYCIQNLNFRWENIIWVLETASDVLAPGFGASSVSGVGDDTATNPGKGRKLGGKMMTNGDNQWF